MYCVIDLMERKFEIKNGNDIIDLLEKTSQTNFSYCANRAVKTSKMANNHSFIIHDNTGNLIELVYGFS